MLTVNELLQQAMTNREPRPRYAYLAPTFGQAKRVAWDYLKHFGRDVVRRKLESELCVECYTVAGDTARVQLLGADDPDALRGIYLDGVVLDEYAQMQPRVWSEVIRPALADRHGWAIFIGTPKGRNAFHSLYRQAVDAPGWFAAVYRASDTGIISSAELEAARRDMSEEEFAQEFECSFDAAIQGSYYGRLIAEAEREGRIARVPWDPAVPVHTAWDLGIGDATAIWFIQQVGKEVHFIDFHESSGVGLDHYAKVLRDRPYVYGDHLVPHDARARELGTGRTRVETLSRLGIRVRVVPRHSIEDGINAVRNLLPRAWIDAARCERGIEALRQYRRAPDNRGGTLRAAPLHDWSSHAADAVRAAAMGFREARGVNPQPATAEGQYAIFRQ